MFRSTAVISVFSLLLTLAGCGGGDSGSGGPTLAQRQATAMRMSNPDARAAELVKVADAQYAAGDRGGGNASLAAAKAAVNEIEEASTRAGVGITVAMALAKHGEDMDAKELLKGVRTTVEADPDPAAKARGLARLALAYGTSLNNPTAAGTYLADAGKLIDAIASNLDRVAVLLEMASAYHQIDRAEEAEAQLTAALEAARATEAPRDQATLLVSTANRMHAMQKTEQAKEVLAEARTAAASVSDDLSRGYALLDLGTAYRTMGDAATSAALLDEAEKAAEKIGDTGLRTELTDAIRRARR